jgi:hypothetical protein
MSRILCVGTLKVKPVRKTTRPEAPFGAGILPKRARFQPSDADRRWAAQAFADGGEPDWDALAAEAACLDAMCSLTPPPVERCPSCGELAEALADGLCPDCERRADEMTHACVNRHFGLGNRVF